jgi:hypothetical protein
MKALMGGTMVQQKSFMKQYAINNAIEGNVMKVALSNPEVMGMYVGKSMKNMDEKEISDIVI